MEDRGPGKRKGGGGGLKLWIVVAGTCFALELTNAAGLPLQSLVVKGRGCYYIHKACAVCIPRPISPAFVREAASANISPPHGTTK